MATCIPTLQVRSNCLIAYDRFEDCKRGNRDNFKKAKTYSGHVTQDARKRLLCALDILVQKTPVKQLVNSETGKTYDHRLSFITLTMTNSARLVDARESYDKLLSKYLRYMKQKVDMKRYVWKAEYQQNGQIHYHLATDQFIPWQLVRWKWNSLCKENRLLDQYAKQYGNFNPNSTDIHKIYSENECYDYIAKEICKDLQNKKVMNGKVWDASDDLKIPRFSKERPFSEECNINQAIQKGKLIPKKLDRCEIFTGQNPVQYLSTNFQTAYKLWAI